MENSTNEINRIRQILLGHNVSEIEKRIVQVEQEFRTKLSLLEAQFAQVTENVLRCERRIQEMTRLMEEKDLQRITVQQQLSKDLTQLTNSMHEESDRLSKLLTNQREEFWSGQAHLAEQNRKELIQLRDQISEKLHLLQESKVDRTAMALLLNQLALELSTNETNRPNKHP